MAGPCRLAPTARPCGQASSFAGRYGFDSARPAQWEVKALEPAELQRLLLAAVDRDVDDDQFAVE
ncbi:hypothetical protein C0Q61_14715 [Streptomyces albidoflavus]|nr:hypothetical protein C0Q61_14715 [Streptomyces albidoflavus]